MNLHELSISDSAASSNEEGSSSSALSFKGTKKKQVTPDVPKEPKPTTQSKKSHKGCQTSGGPFPYKGSASAAASVSGTKKNVKVRL